ncbi:MAG: peptide chain release factor N(5)-glutamine methyltransferase [Sphingobacteriaceae bacterium]
MDTLREFRQQYLHELSPLYDQDEISAIFQIATQDLLSISKSQLVLALNDQCTAQTKARLADYLSELQTGKPIQYVLGKAPFFGMELAVGPATLIPRPETEELIEHILGKEKSRKRADIIDIGTGSGCIALALKLQWPEADVSAVDISADALEIARTNARAFQMEINFRCLNILEWELTFGDEYYDIIVSNPPYVTRTEMQDMSTNVLQFEPHAALFVENETPLLFYDHIASFARKHLRPSGTLYFEINQYLAQETTDLLEKKGFLQVQIFKDINGVSRHISAQVR